MRKTIMAVTLAAVGCAGTLPADTPYPISRELAAANRARVKAQEKDAYWKGAPLAACAVEAMSYIRRLPDLYPPDGDFAGPVRVVAARGEYESGSFQLYAFEELESVELAASDLVCGKAKIPASAIDLKTVKVWYQSGNGWDGCFFVDFSRRSPTPELLLHDDELVRVDHGRKEYFVRCNFEDGVRYRWTSFEGEVVNNRHPHWCSMHPKWIEDAASIRPFALHRDEFKQVMFALHVPGTAESGLYRGSIAVRANGRKAFDIPILVRVLPFELPQAATFRDLKRPFLAHFYNWCNAETPYNCKGVADNIAAHNAIAPKREAGGLEELRETLVRNGTGIYTNFLYCILKGNPMLPYPVPKEGPKHAVYTNHLASMSAQMQKIRSVFGKDAMAYVYGRDEAPPPIVRQERASFLTCQDAGGRISISSHYYPFLLFNIDMLELPGQGRYVNKSAVIEKLHAGEPDMLLGWYADPHSGPENPDYSRRLYGWQAWRANYDMCSQFILFRENWNDFWIPEESNMRGLMIVYPQHNGLLDTTQWEGIREGIDDVRYATYLLQLCEQARKSADIETVYVARAARTWLAQVDSERAAVGYLRAETIRRILKLRKLLGK